MKKFNKSAISLMFFATLMSYPAWSMNEDEGNQNSFVLNANILTPSRGTIEDLIAKGDAVEITPPITKSLTFNTNISLPEDKIGLNFKLDSGQTFNISKYIAKKILKSRKEEQEKFCLLKLLSRSTVWSNEKKHTILFEKILAPDFIEYVTETIPSQDNSTSVPRYIRHKLIENSHHYLVYFQKIEDPLVLEKAMVLIKHTFQHTSEFYKATDKGMNLILKVLEDRSNLSKLNLDFCTINKENTKKLSQLLSRHKIIDSLNLKYTIEKSMKCTIEKSKLFLNLNNIKSLQLQYFHFSSKEIKALSENIKENKKMTSLFLNYCTIDNDQAEILSDALGKNRSIQILDLNGTRFSLKRIEFLLNALNNNNKTLTTLYMDGCFNGEVSILQNKNPIIVFSKFLESNKIVQYLHLNQNNICDRGAGLLLEALCSNTALMDLNLYGNDKIKAHTINNIDKKLENNRLLPKY